MDRIPLIQFDHFTFKYASQQETTLNDINLIIYEGEKVLILGQSGSGKSSLIHCINGLIPFSFSGEINGSLKVAGMETKHASIFALSKQVGTVLQDSDAQFVALSVEEDIAFALENQAMKRSDMIPMVMKAADKVSMTGFLKQAPFNLSGGQKQKVALAGVLHEQVKLLLFDEPLASLDPFSGQQAIELIDLIHQDNKTIIIVEHRFEDVLYRHIDRVIVMHEGRIIYDGKVDDLIKADLITSYGLREPLYIQALRYAKVDITKMDDVADLQKIDFRQYKTQLEKLNLPIKKEEPNLSEVLFEVKQVSFAYEDKDVLADISFTIKQGEKIAFIGKNGAGKSTMAKLLCGIIRPRIGSIHYKQTDILTLSIAEIGQHVGFVMQNPNQMIVKHLIRDEVMFALALNPKYKLELEDRVNEALHLTDLYTMRNWPVNALSYGQKKRLTVAAILALKPDILILDEPTAGQDYKHYTEIMEFLNTLNLKQRITFIFITHDMHLAIEYTDRVLVFSEGALIADQKVYDALSNQDIITKANLKQTSLYTLAQQCHFEPERVIQNFILQRKTHE